MNRPNNCEYLTDGTTTAVVHINGDFFTTVSNILYIFTSCTNT